MTNVEFSSFCYPNKFIFLNSQRSIDEENVQILTRSTHKKHSKNNAAFKSNERRIKKYLWYIYEKIFLHYKNIYRLLIYISTTIMLYMKSILPHTMNTAVPCRAS